MKLKKVLIIRNGSYSTSPSTTSSSFEEEECEIYKEAIEESISTLPSLPR